MTFGSSTPPTPLSPELQPKASPTPWWRVGMVWLVLAGPLTVVVAAVATAVIAIKGAEPVLPAESGREFSERPALQGRNHAAAPQPKR